MAACGVALLEAGTRTGAVGWHASARLIWAGLRFVSLDETSHVVGYGQQARHR